MKGQKGLTRREMLKLSAAVGAGSLLVACAPTVTSTVASTLVPPTIASTAVPPTVAPTIVPPTSAPAPAGAVTLEVFNPVGAYEVTQTFAPRIDTLAGKTICEVTNGSWEAARTDPYIIDQLKKLYPTATFIPSSALPKLSTTIEVAGLEDAVKALKCDAVIVGNAG